MSAVLDIPFPIPKPDEGLANGGNVNHIPAKKPLTSTMGNLSTEEIQEVLRGVLAEKKDSNVIPIQKWIIVSFAIPFLLLVVWFVQWRTETNNQLELQKDRILALEKAKDNREEEEKNKFREEVKELIIEAGKKGEERGYTIRQVDNGTGHTRK